VNEAVLLGASSTKSSGRRIADASSTKEPEPPNAPSSLIKRPSVSVKVPLELGK
jgi:hypothetical protein